LSISGIGFDKQVFASTWGDFLETFSIDRTYDFTANTIYTVTMTAQGSADTGGLTSYFAHDDGFASFTASVDPVFTLPDAYTLLLSNGISNTISHARVPFVMTALP